VSLGIRGPYTLWYRSATAVPPVSRAQFAARCSCASLLVAYAFRGSRAASSRTVDDDSAESQTGQRGSNTPASRSAVARGSGRTLPSRGQS